MKKIDKNIEKNRPKYIDENIILTKPYGMIYVVAIRDGKVDGKYITINEKNSNKLDLKFLQPWTKFCFLYE